MQRCLTTRLFLNEVRDARRSRLGAAALSSCALVALLILGLGASRAMAQGQPPDAEAAAARQEKARLADADTSFALTNDGAILYSPDSLKLSGDQDPDCKELPYTGAHWFETDGFKAGVAGLLGLALVAGGFALRRQRG